MVRLCLTVIGTTSSGKSTLVNLIVGRLLMPINVQESPRVVVRVRHVQTHPGQPDEAMRLRLEKQIHSALETGGTIHVDVPIDLARPRRLIDWLLRRPRLPSLPPDAEVSICDLPGYLHQGDQAALDTIEANLDGTTAVVVFNAEETDTRKEDELIRFVLEKKRQRQHTWGEMVFVLNRADVFGRDPHRIGERERRLADLHRRCAEHIADVFSLRNAPEVTLHVLSALPALAGQLLERSGSLGEGDRRYALELAARSASLLLDELHLDRLPRSPRRWRSWHARDYCRAVKQLSGWPKLRAALCACATEETATIIHRNP